MIMIVLKKTQTDHHHVVNRAGKTERREDREQASGKILLSYHRSAQIVHCIYILICYIKDNKEKACTLFRLLSYFNVSSPATTEILVKIRVRKDRTRRNGALRIQLWKKARNMPKSRQNYE